MAGGGSLGGGGKVKRGKSSKRKKMKRVGFHLDMTPLVDITFLLLTFFMFTTTMATPQVMEMSVPPEQDVEIEVKESELMSLLVDDEGKIYYYLATDEAEEIKLKDLKAISERENLKQKNRLITVLKVSEEAPYGQLISILDILNLAEVNITKEIVKGIDNQTGLPLTRQRKFTIADITEDDIKKIEEAKK